MLTNNNFIIIIIIIIISNRIHRCTAVRLARRDARRINAEGDDDGKTTATLKITFTSFFANC